MELKIPRIDWFILIYFSAYISFFPPLFLFPFEKQLKVSKALILSGFLGGIIFLIFPTQLGYERNIEEIKIFKNFYLFLWGQDRPSTLMPSFHVAMSAIFIFPSIEYFKKKYVRIFLSIWLFLISISIVLVHQHHLIDIPTGLILAKISLKLGEKKLGVLEF